MNLVAMRARLLLGSSYEFEKAVDARFRDGVSPNATALERIALESAYAIVMGAFMDRSEWRICRSIEAIHHAEWLWRKARMLADGPAGQVAA